MPFLNLSRNSCTVLVFCLAVGLAGLAGGDEGGLPQVTGLSAAPPYSQKFVDDMMAASQAGDAQRGILVFASTKFACIACHRIGGQGGRIGPDLSDVGKKRPLQYLVESLFWPKRHVDPQFLTQRIITIDGHVLQGYVVQEDSEQIKLRDPATQQERILKLDDIEQRAQGTTLMPEGLTSAMTAEETRDLIRFLSELGREDGLSAEIVAPVLEHARAHAHGPATFSFEPGPLEPENWPHRGALINEMRIYDFYAKEADYFRQQSPVPPLLMEFPGVELEAGSSEFRRRSKQDDPRWNETEIRPLLSGVFRADDLEIPRGICVRLGDSGDMGACFNPETLNYEAVWRGKFLKFSSVRHGFMDGLKPGGELLPVPPQREVTEPFEYHGFYRYGNRVIFSYRIGDVEYLDSPWAKDGTFERIVAPRHEHPLEHFTHGGPPQWKQEFLCPIEFGNTRPYAVDTISLPYENPWNDLLFLGGVAFLPDGAALVCTMQGDVWRAEGFEYPSTEVRWRKVAAGMHQAQGIVADESGVFVVGRDQITRLHDLNGDGEYDYHECFCNGYVTSAFGHDFICGLERDSLGNFYTASSKQGLLKISPDGKQVSVIATGFRNPDGVGILPDDSVTVPCSQGNWTPASMICAVPTTTKSTPSNVVPHYGYGGPQNGEPPALPLVYLPRGLDNSSGGQTLVTSHRWGPLQNQLLHFSYGSARHFLVLTDEVDGQKQGAIIPLVGDFRSGVHRGRFRPQDGQLYVAGQAGWGAFTIDDGCFERVRYTGDVVQLPLGFHVHENGIQIDFAEPLDTQQAEHVQNHFAQCWNYRYSGAYGSPEFSPSHFGTPGHDPLEIRSAHLLKDGCSLFLEIPEIQPVNQLHLRLRVDDGAPQNLFLTVHALDKPFKDFPGYQPVKKTIRQHPLLADLAMESKRVPNRWKSKIKGARSISLKTSGNLQFNKRLLKATPGEAIALTLSNADVVPHNWALLKEGKLESVGQLANQLVSDPDAYPRQYIPLTDDVLSYCDIVEPGKKFTIYFHAPEKPGRYPYVCTYPGHWTVMNGILEVTDPAP